VPYPAIEVLRRFVSPLYLACLYSFAAVGAYVCVPALPGGCRSGAIYVKVMNSIIKKGKGPPHHRDSRLTRMLSGVRAAERSLFCPGCVWLAALGESLLWVYCQGCAQFSSCFGIEEGLRVVIPQFCLSCL